MAAASETCQERRGRLQEQMGEWRGPQPGEAEENSEEQGMQDMDLVISEEEEEVEMVVAAAALGYEGMGEREVKEPETADEQGLQDMDLVISDEEEEVVAAAIGYEEMWGAGVEDPETAAMAYQEMWELGVEDPEAAAAAAMGYQEMWGAGIQDPEAEEENAEKLKVQVMAKEEEVAALLMGYDEIGGPGVQELEAAEENAELLGMQDTMIRREEVAAEMGVERVGESGDGQSDIEEGEAEKAGDMTEQKVVRPLEEEQEKMQAKPQQTMDTSGVADKKQQKVVQPEAGNLQCRATDLSCNSLKTTNTKDAALLSKTDEDDLLNFERRIFFCQICQVPCLSESVLQLHYRGARHKKREKAMKSEIFLGITMSNQIKSLADYIKEPSREPLIGLEYVVEHRTPGKKTPTYNCELCEYKTELAPIVQHLIGFKHRKAYIAKEFPFLLKTPPGIKEDRIQFLRRMAQDIEKDEGIKMYKIDPGPKLEPLMSVKPPAEHPKQKTRWGPAQEDKNSQKEQALKFLETFEIDSDNEAYSIITLTESLTHALKGYCFQQKAIAKANEINMSFANQIKAERWAKEAKWAKQFTQAANQAIAQAAFLTLQYNSVGDWNTEPSGNSNRNQNSMMQNQQNQWVYNSRAENWNPGNMQNQQPPNSYGDGNSNQKFMMENRGRFGGRYWNRKPMNQTQQGHSGFGNQNPMMQNQYGGYGIEGGNINQNSMLQNQSGSYSCGDENLNQVQHTSEVGSWNQESVIFNQETQRTSEDGSWNQDFTMHNQQAQQVQCISGEGIWNSELEMQKQIQCPSGYNFNLESMILKQAQQSQYNSQSGNRAFTMENQVAQKVTNNLPFPMATSSSRVVCSTDLSNWDNQPGLSFFPSTSSGNPSYSHDEYLEDSDLRHSSKIYEIRRPHAARDENRRLKSKHTDRDFPFQRASYPAAGGDDLSEDIPSCFIGRSEKNDMILAKFPTLTKNGSGWPHQHHLDSFRKFPQDTRSSKITERNSMNLPPEIVNRVRGKDVFTATAILNQLATHHPALQKLNISNLVNVLVENGIIE
ncbi:uncharacterized protein LOC115084727 [Rhinatrema bivittatum]|uniref:uncharacterized protein LOC115084727 n=1 Tax=Rhinatrema bivittatum TaxID=194408 RepID=UPI001126459A|nr:uncharacterized protein LOC115084727 [Rhinatrema bivittatum]XP_029445826.1 uncharacterized protein LOC115084727 [Rhinatrema bivittatum]